MIATEEQQERETLTFARASCRCFRYINHLLQTRKPPLLKLVTPAVQKIWSVLTWRAALSSLGSIMGDSETWETQPLT